MIFLSARVIKTNYTLKVHLEKESCHGFQIEAFAHGRLLLLQSYCNQWLRTYFGTYVSLKDLIYLLEKEVFLCCIAIERIYFFLIFWKVCHFYQHKNSFGHHFCSGHFQKTFSICLVLCNTIRDWILNLCQNIHVLKPATAIAAAIPALAARMNIVLTWVFFRFLKHWMSCKNRCSHKIFFPFQFSLFTTAAALV